MKDDIDSLSMEDHILKKFLVLQIDSVLVIVDDVDGVSVVLEVNDLQCDPLGGLCGALWSLDVHPSTLHMSTCHDASVPSINFHLLLTRLCLFSLVLHVCRSVDAVNVSQ